VALDDGNSKSTPIHNNEFEILVATIVDNNGKSRRLKWKQFANSLQVILTILECGVHWRQTNWSSKCRSSHRWLGEKITWLTWKPCKTSSNVLRNSYRVLQKRLSWRSYGDHQGTKEAHTKCWRKKRSHDYHMETM
jgi:hypothetical protein